MDFYLCKRPINHLLLTSMKRIVQIIIGFICLINASYAQQPLVLTYETHALQAGANNNMILCHYADPGDGGENVVWDYSFLESTLDFTGTITTNTRSKTSDAFGQANTALEEFNYRFYLHVAPDQIEQIGYSSFDNSFIVSYEKPLVKMVFPFTKGDRYNGDFFGFLKMGDATFPLTGNYEVEADGYGRLLLPGNVSVDNTLRVKTIKYYEMPVNGLKHFTEIITFRWYGCCNRYPLLVLTAIKTSIGSSVTHSYQAAFNNKINFKLSGTNGNRPLSSIHAYPNPAADHMTLEYVLTDPDKVIIDIYNDTGKKMKTLLDSQVGSGTYRLQLVPKKEGLSTGIYFITANLNNTIVTEEIVITK